MAGGKTALAKPNSDELSRVRLNEGMSEVLLARWFSHDVLFSLWVLVSLYACNEQISNKQDEARASSCYVRCTQGSGRKS